MKKILNVMLALTLAFSGFMYSCNLAKADTNNEIPLKSVETTTVTKTKNLGPYGTVTLVVTLQYSSSKEAWVYYTHRGSLATNSSIYSHFSCGFETKLINKGNGYCNINVLITNSAYDPDNPCYKTPIKVTW